MGRPKTRKTRFPAKNRFSWAPENPKTRFFGKITSPTLPKGPFRDLPKAENPEMLAILIPRNMQKKIICAAAKPFLNFVF